MLPEKGALYQDRFRVIVSTDIGGSDPDDFQSMVHYLLYANLFDTEGLISSAWGAGRRDHILEVIDEYEKDYPVLKAKDARYPSPEYLRSISVQGEIRIAPYEGFRKPTPGSKLIISCARKKDPRPLYILGWGLLEDIAQALHDAPDILPRLRVNYIGGPNKKWGLNAYQYIRQNFPDLWIIEDNSTYRGWFNGGLQTPEYTNQGFVDHFIRNHGHLGNYFASKLGGVIKMGDTPTVTWLLRGTPEDPEQDSLGGRFARVFHRPERTFFRDTHKEDLIEIFEVVEYVFQGPVLEGRRDVSDPALQAFARSGPCSLQESVDEDRPVFKMQVQGQLFDGAYLGNGEYRIRFMPKALGLFEYQILSEFPELAKHRGAFTAIPENPSLRMVDDQRLTHWYSDVLETDAYEGDHAGAKTLNQYRKLFLDDFAEKFRILK